MVQRNTILISLLCILIFVGLFQTQYPRIYEGFTNDSYETKLILVTIPQMLSI